MRGGVGIRRAASLGLAALALSACVADQTGSVGTPRAVRVPAEAPRVTGRDRATDADHLKLVASFGGEAKAPAVTRLLNEVTDRLVRAGDRPDQSYVVTLLDSPVVNAFALPNGRLYVTRGLVALANDTSEVAGVLAHEIAHVTLNHATARSELELRSALVSKVVADVLNDPDTGAQLKNQSRFALARFSREQELEADAAGVKTLAAAGYDPFAEARFLTALNRTIQLKQGGGTANEPDMLATHPGTAERVALADSFIALDYMFGKMQWMLDGLQTYPAKMEHNLWRTRGLIFSSKVLLALVDAGITREDAYIIVQRNAMKVWEDIQNAVDGPTYRERLEADPEAAALLPAAKLDEIFDPWGFLTRKDVVFERLEGLEF